MATCNNSPGINRDHTKPVARLSTGLTDSQACHNQVKDARRPTCPVCPTQIQTRYTASYLRLVRSAYYTCRPSRPCLGCALGDCVVTAAAPRTHSRKSCHQAGEKR